MTNDYLMDERVHGMGGRRQGREKKRGRNPQQLKHNNLLFPLLLLLPSTLPYNVDIPVYFLSSFPSLLLLSLMRRPHGGLM